MFLFVFFAPSRRLLLRRLLRHHQHNIINTTSSTRHHQHYTIYTTSSKTTSSTHHLHIMIDTTQSTLHHQKQHHQHNTINTTPPRQHHQHNTIINTPFTQHHQHYTIYTTSSKTTSSTQHHQHDTIKTTPSTQHHQHIIINTTHTINTEVRGNQATIQYCGHRLRFRGRHSTWSTSVSFCVASAALGAPPSHFASQAQHLEHLRPILRGRCSTRSISREVRGSPATIEYCGRRLRLRCRRSTWSTSVSFCMAGAARRAPQFHYAWQVLHAEHLQRGPRKPGDDPFSIPFIQHHPHNTIYTTASHTGRCSTWSTAILPHSFGFIPAATPLVMLCRCGLFFVLFR